MELGVEAGDYIDIDGLVEQLKAKGYEAKYENIVSHSGGFWAKMTVKHKDDIVYIYVSGDSMGHFIENIDM